MLHVCALCCLADGLAGHLHPPMSKLPHLVKNTHLQSVVSHIDCPANAVFLSLLAALLINLCGPPLTVMTSATLPLVYWSLTRIWWIPGGQ